MWITLFAYGVLKKFGVGWSIPPDLVLKRVVCHSFDNTKIGLIWLSTKFIF
jgi:hypothetical protein